MGTVYFSEQTNPQKPTFLFILTKETNMIEEHKAEILKGDKSKIKIKELPNLGLNPYELEKVDSGELSD